MKKDIYKIENNKRVLNVKKVNKVLKAFKQIRDELDCDTEIGEINCSTCPFKKIHNCDVFRANIDAIRMMRLPSENK